jgi:hypothetical protein
MCAGLPFTTAANNREQVLCGVVYWVLMVMWYLYSGDECLTNYQVYPMGYGQGSAGVNGTGFQLLIIIFMLMFGVTFGQLIASLTPSIQVKSRLALIASLFR